MGVEVRREASCQARAAPRRASRLSAGVFGSTEQPAATSVRRPPVASSAVRTARLTSSGVPRGRVVSSATPPITAAGVSWIASPNDGLPGASLFQEMAWTG